MMASQSITSAQTLHLQPRAVARRSCQGRYVTNRGGGGVQRTVIPRPAASGQWNHGTHSHRRQEVEGL
jgi:hypothetical protein